MAAATGATAAWGVGNVAVAATPLGGLALAFHRLWMGALLYGVALLMTGRPSLSLAKFRIAGPAALAFAADIAFFFEATRHTTLADATTISALQPLLVLTLAGRRFGERVRPQHIGCAAAAVAGVAMVVQASADTGRVTLYGEVMAILATVAWAWYFTASKEARRHLGTVELLTLVFLMGIPVLGIAAMASGQLTGPGSTLDAEALGWVGLVVLLPGSGHLLLNWSHRQTTITFTSLVTLLMAPISAICAAIWLDQPLSALQGVGIAVVVAAMVPVVMLERS